MPLPIRFSKEDLHSIIEQAAVYLCACPAQVCTQILHLRELYDYQADCGGQPNVNAEVHQRIGAATAEAHRVLENCLDDLLTLENWDRETLTMPAGLRLLRDQAIKGA